MFILTNLNPQGQGYLKTILHDGLRLSDAWQ